jgi:hypothetical protein
MVAKVFEPFRHEPRNIVEKGSSGFGDVSSFGILRSAQNDGCFMDVFWEGINRNVS